MVSLLVNWVGLQKWDVHERLITRKNVRCSLKSNKLRFFPAAKMYTLRFELSDWRVQKCEFIKYRQQTGTNIRHCRGKHWTGINRNSYLNNWWDGLATVPVQTVRHTFELKVLALLWGSDGAWWPLEHSGMVKQTDQLMKSLVKIIVESIMGKLDANQGIKGG